MGGAPMACGAPPPPAGVRATVASCAPATSGQESTRGAAPPAHDGTVTSRPASLFILLFTLVLLDPPARATQYYVAPTGRDANSGLSGQPWATLQKAADTMLAGDSVLVA